VRCPGRPCADNCLSKPCRIDPESIRNEPEFARDTDKLDSVKLTLQLPLTSMPSFVKQAVKSALELAGLSAVQKVLCRGLRLLAFEPGAAKNAHQDVFLLQKTS
jgi:hypothetical protein